MLGCSIGKKVDSVPVPEPSCKTNEWLSRAINIFILPLVVSDHSLAWPCSGRLGLLLLYWAAYKFVCSTRMLKNLSVRNGLKMSPAEGLFGSWALIPREPVKAGKSGSL